MYEELLELLKQHNKILLARLHIKERPEYVPQLAMLNERTLMSLVDCLQEQASRPTRTDYQRFLLNQNIPNIIGEEDVL